MLSLVNIVKGIVMFIGCRPELANVVFVLPNPPLLSAEDNNEGHELVEQIVALNGNHWRKILTIIAKLTCRDGEWRKHKQNSIFNKESILFIKNIVELKNMNLADHALTVVVGKQLRSGFPIPDQAQCINPQYDVWLQGRIVWTPYLDYRQFPNSLIEALKKNGLFQEY